MTTAIHNISESLARRLPHAMHGRLGRGLERLIQRRVEDYFRGMLHTVAGERGQDVVARHMLRPDADAIAEALVSLVGNRSGELYTALFLPVLTGYALIRHPELKKRRLFERPVREAATSEGAVNKGIRYVMAKSNVAKAAKKAVLDLLQGPDPRAFDYAAPIRAEVVQWAREHVGTMGREINATTRRELANIIADGIQGGKGGIDIARDIKAIAPDMSVSRARLIANTETNEALSKAAKERAVELGATSHAWITVGDDRVSEGCRQNEAMGWIPMGQQFPAESRMANGHERPPRHPNCRCAEAFKNESEQEQAA